MIHYLVAFFSFFIVSGTNIHDHYVSITTIHLNDDSKKIELTIQLTAHDIEYYFEKEKNFQLHLGTAKENPKADELLSVYIQKHLTFLVDNQPLKIKYLGKETKLDETLWLYFEGDLPNSLSSLEIKNDILLQSFENQHYVIKLYPHN